MHIKSEHRNTRIVTMTLKEFMERLELPGRPVTVFTSWDGSEDAVRIYLESE